MNLAPMLRLILLRCPKMTRKSIFHPSFSMNLGLRSGSDTLPIAVSISIILCGLRLSQDVEVSYGPLGPMTQRGPGAATKLDQPHRDREGMYAITMLCVCSPTVATLTPCHKIGCKIVHSVQDFHN